MALARAGEVEIYYEVVGQPETVQDPLLLIPGVGCPSFYWNDGLCEVLLKEGCQLIRVDCRDVGRSSKLSHLGMPPLLPLMLRYAAKRRINAPYSLSDMAADMLSVLDAVSARRVHVAGVSLGGAVAQALATDHPGRVASLTSIMSTTGARRYSWGSPSAFFSLFGRAPRDANEAGRMALERVRAVGSTGFAIDEDGIQERARRTFEMDGGSNGMRRQLAALWAAGNRSRRLARIRCPTLVIHGDRDGLIPLSAGRAVARCVPGARMMVVNGMGHDLPPGAYATLGQAIAKHARMAGEAPRRVG